ncbi:BgtTE-56046 [Blumeria graminis f. sp. tritici]|uniref:BgtTE-56046 n=1 Tax=Blumeria graminis f. sp. tritici TaxID=62690 RepID=A0A9X9MFL7_BLUGR|nr:BgtTE-56046 [Blumeria graminis f. sp. tritici]
MLVNLGLIRVALLMATNALICYATQYNTFASAFAWYSHGIGLDSAARQYGTAPHVDRLTLTGNIRDRVQSFRTITQ